MSINRNGYMCICVVALFMSFVALVHIVLRVTIIKADNINK